MQPSDELLTVVYGFVAASLVVWFVVGRRLIARRPILAFSPRRPVPWTSTETVVLFGVMIVLESVAAGAAASFFGRDELRDKLPILLAGAGAKVVAVFVAAGFLTWRRGAQPADLGIAPNAPRRDAWLGFVTFLAVIAPVVAIQISLNWWDAQSKIERSDHPLLELVRDRRDLSTLAVAVLLAVVVAPVAEELFFRTLLQGGLESALTARFFQRDGTQATTIAGPRSAPLAGEESSGVGSGQEFSQHAPESAKTEDSADTPQERDEVREAHDTFAYRENPYAAPADVRDSYGASSPTARANSGPSPDQEPDSLPAATISIAVSSVFFAMMHASSWPDPVPLLALAVVFGYVYWRTHSIWPTVAAHALFNASNLAILWFSIE